MQFATVKELRQDLRRLLERVGEGERVIITKRGKPVAVLSPFPAEGEEALPISLRPFAEAWAEIERALEESEPAFPTVEEAPAHTRSRSRSRPQAKAKR